MTGRSRPVPGQSPDNPSGDGTPSYEWPQALPSGVQAAATPHSPIGTWRRYAKIRTCPMPRTKEPVFSQPGRWPLGGKPSLMVMLPALASRRALGARAWSQRGLVHLLYTSRTPQTVIRPLGSRNDVSAYARVRMRTFARALGAPYKGMRLRDFRTLWPGITGAASKLSIAGSNPVARCEVWSRTCLLRASERNAPRPRPPPAHRPLLPQDWQQD